MQRLSAHVHARLVFVLSQTALAGALLLAGSACKVSRSLGADPADVIVRPPDAHGSPPASGGPVTDPGGVVVRGDDAGEVVDGSQPGTAETCWGRLRSQVFARAVCACRDATLGAGGFLSDAFDSSEGPYNAAGRTDINAAVGVNRELRTAGFVAVSGDLTVTSPDGLSLAGIQVNLLGDLRVRGLLRASGVAVSVEGDAWLEGGFKGSGVVNISGDRIMPPAASSGSTGSVLVGGSERREPIAIEPPCACEDADVPDLTTAIRRAQTDNDNAANGFDSASLLDIKGQEVVSLAGRVYSTGVRVRGQLAQLSLVVDDKVSMFIDGDLIVEGGLPVQLGAAGELDLFVAGGLALSGVANVGNPEQPARVRVYVAGEGPVRITGTVTVGANLYAPRASVVVQGTHELYGSVFALDVNANQNTAIHYDAAVVHSGDACPLEP